VTETGKIIFLILISSVKFAVGPVFAFYDEKYDFTFFERFLYPAIGGMLGVFVFAFFSDYLNIAWLWLKATSLKFFSKNKNRIFSEPTVDIDGKVSVNYSYIEKEQKTKKIFTRKNRRIVKIWKKYGLIGIALITPVIISIPVGTIIATRLIPERKKVLLYLCGSVIFWSLTMTSVFELYHVVTVKGLQNKILAP